MFSLKNEYTYFDNFDFNVKTVSFNETDVTYVLYFLKLRQMFQLQFQSHLKASTTKLSNYGHANSTYDIIYIFLCQTATFLQLEATRMQIFFFEFFKQTFIYSRKIYAFHMEETVL